MTRVKTKGASVMTMPGRVAELTMPPGVSSGDETPMNGELPLALPLPDSTEQDTLSVPALVHPKRNRARRQRWTTPARIAAYFGVTRGTVCSWLRRKAIGAHVITDCHYTDDRPRKTGRGRWRIFESDLEKLLVAMRVRPGAAGLGPGFWVGGGK